MLSKILPQCSPENLCSLLKQIKPIHIRCKKEPSLREEHSQYQVAWTKYQQAKVSTGNGSKDLPALGQFGNFPLSARHRDAPHQIFQQPSVSSISRPSRGASAERYLTTSSNAQSASFLSLSSFDQSYLMTESVDSDKGGFDE